MVRRLALCVLALLALLAPAAPAWAQDCPGPPGPADAAVPTWEAVHGFALGSRQATYAEVVTYMRRVDAASERVALGSLASSFQGRDLVYAVVSEPGRVAGDGLEAVAAPLRALREERPKLAAALATADRTPAIVWITAGVHGNEPSATDAHMRVLYELAARGDCENLRRLRELVTVLLPMQNPDGRENGARTNAYAFDLNRDWFARSQPETEGKLRMLRELPPMLYVDGHEQGGTAGFFPPNADPIHHEIAAQPLHHINDVYSPAMRAAMDARGADYTNYTVYDLFFMGYGDTVPATLFGGAGMTFEKGGQAPYPEKEADHFTLADTVLDVAAARKDELLADWARVWFEARQQGAVSRLEPNLVVQPENQVRFAVPEQTVWAYALRADRSGADAAALVERLRSMGVAVERLRRSVRVAGFRPFGGAPGAARLPQGTWIVRMGQPNKHWVQALLGEDAYVPFPYFYDVSSWSNPLQMGLDGGTIMQPVPRRTLRPRRRAALLEPVDTAPEAGALSAAAAYAFEGDSAGALRAAFELLAAGAEVRRAPAGFSARAPGTRRRPGPASSFGTGTIVAPASTPRSLLRRLAGDHHLNVRRLAAMPAGTVALARPRVALLFDPVSAAAELPVPGRPLGIAQALSQSTGWTRFVLERRLVLPVVMVTTAEVAAGRLGADAFTHLVVPDGTVPDGGFDPVALQRLQEWVAGGGTYVGFRGQGIDVARAAGLTAARTAASPEGFQVPGAAFRVAVEAANPLAWGFAGEGWVFNTGDPILEPGSSAGAEVVRYPAGERFFVSGYTEGAEALKGTPVALDEPVGAGRALLLTVDPNFRAYVESSERLFSNALLYPRRPAVARSRPASPPRPELLVGGRSPARDTVVRVPLDEGDALRAAAARAAAPAGARWEVTRRGLQLRVPNAAPFPGHAPEWVEALLRGLRERGVRPTLVIV